MGVDEDLAALRLARQLRLEFHAWKMSNAVLASLVKLRERIARGKSEEQP